MGIKFRLIVMNFLQYAIWGSWLISLGAYLGGGLDFTGLQSEVSLPRWALRRCSCPQ